MPDEKCVKTIVFPDGAGAKLLESVGITSVRVPLSWLAADLNMTPTELMDMIDQREKEEECR